MSTSPQPKDDLEIGPFPEKNLGESDTESDFVEEEQDDQEAPKPTSDNGPFLTKLCLVFFVFVILVGAVTVDERVRAWWNNRKQESAEKVDPYKLDFAKKEANVKLTPEEQYRLHVLKL